MDIKDELEGHQPNEMAFSCMWSPEAAYSGLRGTIKTMILAALVTAATMAGGALADEKTAEPEASSP